MTSQTGKINTSSMRVLRTLLYLFEKSRSMKELIEVLNKDNTGSYNNFVISKYINTCKSCGIDIQKINNKYTIINFPIGMKFSSKESKLIYEIKTYSENLKSGETEKHISNLIDRLHLTFFKASNGLLSSDNYRIIKMFEKACLAKCDVQIIFKDKTFYTCSPKELRVVDKKVVFYTYNNLEAKEIKPDDILDVRILGEEGASSSSENVVVFELYGSLARRYQLRENESMLTTKRSGVFVVQNKFEDKKHLLHRLMRYDSSCKIIRQQSYVYEMKEMIERSIENYKSE